jgi:hypothetical protein
MEVLMCCPLAFGVLLYVMVGWAVLAGGCGLYNRLVGPGSPERVREPNFGRAAVVLLAALPAGAVVGFAVHGAGGAFGRALGAEPRRLELALMLQTWPLSLVVLGALLGGTLPTTFARGLLVALCCVLLVACVVAGLAAVVLVIYAVATLAG